MNATSLTASAIILSTLLFIVKRNRQTKKKNTNKDCSQSEIVFLGSGSSTGTPFLQCVNGSIPRTMNSKCEVCLDALTNREHTKNYRNNPCLMIKYKQDKIILIDFGKTIRDSCLRFFPQHDIKGIDDVIITHEHADAFMGLDELRTVQRLNYDTLKKMNQEDEKNKKRKKHWLRSIFIPINLYASTKCMPSIERCFPYLLPKEQDEAEIQRYVAQVTFNTFELEQEFQISSGLKVQPIKVLHGADFVSSAFIFGEEDLIVYISDVSEIPENSFKIIENKKKQNVHGKIKLLIIDSLRRNQVKNRPLVHFSIEEAIETCKILTPERCLIVGISHEMDHDKTNSYLKTHHKDLNIELSFDGMTVNNLKL